METVTNERRIEGEGTPEAEWLDWLPRCPVPALPWPPTGIEASAPQRLVVVAPHPDDEVLACGGLLSLQVARGGPVRILAVTDGEGSHAMDDEGARAALARTRQGERLAGLARLGVPPSSLQTLGLPDGQVAAHAAALRHALATLLRPGDLVVCTWRLDGHPDHEACGQAAAEVCPAAGAQWLEAPVWMWHWAHPLDTRVPWERLRRLTLTGPARASKATALAEHRSQLQPRGTAGGPVLGAAIQARARRPAEYFLAGVA